MILLMKINCQNEIFLWLVQFVLHHYLLFVSTCSSLSYQCLYKELPCSGHFFMTDGNIGFPQLHSQLMQRTQWHLMLFLFVQSMHQYCTVSLSMCCSVEVISNLFWRDKLLSFMHTFGHSVVGHFANGSFAIIFSNLHLTEFEGMTNNIVLK
jgi:hypothetical protein